MMAGSYAAKKVLTELSVAEAVHFQGNLDSRTKSWI